MKTMSITTRVNPDTKRKAEIIAESLGLNLSEAISIFLAKFVDYQGIPFEVANRPKHYEYSPVFDNLEDLNNWLDAEDDNV